MVVVRADKRKDLIILSVLLLIHNMVVPSSEDLTAAKLIKPEHAGRKVDDDGAEAIEYQEVLDMIQGLNGWNTKIKGVQYTCYTYYVATCKKMVIKANWKKLPSRSKGVPSRWLINKEEVKLFCGSSKRAKCERKGKLPWTLVSNWKRSSSSQEDQTTTSETTTSTTERSTFGPSKVKGSISEDEVLDEVDGQNGYSATINGVQYNCYSVSVDGCEETVGEGDWESIPDSNKKRMAGSLYNKEGNTNVLCKAKNKSKCKIKGKKPWKRVRKPRKPSTETPQSVQGSVDQQEVIESLDGLPGWKMNKDGVQYMCYAASVDECEQSVGEGNWESIPDSEKKKIGNSLFTDEDGAKVFCKAHDKSKCKTKGKKPWKRVRKTRKPSTESPQTVQGSVDQQEVIESLDGLPGWKMNKDGVQYMCYAASVDECEQSVGEGDWESIPDSEKKKIGNSLFTDEDGAKVFCKAHDKSKCKTKGKKPWKRVPKTRKPSTESPQTVQGSVDQQEVIESLDGLPGWKMNKDGVQYMCYAASVDECEQSVGEGDWESIPDSEKKKIGNSLFTDEDGAKVFCKAHDKSKCKTKGKKPWKRVPKTRKPSTESPQTVQGSVDQQEVIESLDGLPGWKMNKDGVQYMCYAASVDECEQSVGEGDWESIPDSEKKKIGNSLFTDEDGAKVFCKAHDKSKCKTKGKKPWKRVRKTRKPSTESPQTVQGSVDQQEVIESLDGLPGWKMNKDGVQYMCYAASVDECEQSVGEGDWESIPDSEKKKIGNSLFTDEDGAKVFCKAHDKSKCKTKGKKPWKRVRKTRKPSTESPQTVQGSVDQQEVIESLDGLPGWKMNKDGVQYMCYAASVDECEQSVGEGDWESIPDSEKKKIGNSLFTDEDGAKVFCKAHDKSKCKTKGKKPWKRVPKTRKPSTESPQTVQGSVDQQEVIESLDGLPGWKMNKDGVQYMCYAASVDECEQSVGEGDWESIPDSEKKKIGNSLFTDEDGAKVFCKAHDKSKCKTKGKKPWKRVRKTRKPSTESPQRVQGSVDQQEVIESLDGLPGWKMNKDGVQYMCYAASVDECEQSVGEGDWESIPDSEKKKIGNSLFTDEDGAKVFCKAHDKSKCKTKGKKPWKRVPKTRKPSTESTQTVEGSISEREIANELDGLPGWKMNKDGILYICYAASVDKCEKTVGVGDWECILGLPKKLIHDSLFNHEGGTKVFCKAQDKSKCKIKGKKPWKRVRIYNEPPSSNDDKWIVDANWSTKVKGVLLFCKAPFHANCPPLPEGAEPWQPSNGEGAKVFFHDFQPMSLDLEMTDATCVHMKIKI